MPALHNGHLVDRAAGNVHGAVGQHGAVPHHASNRVNCHCLDSACVVVIPCPSQRMGEDERAHEPEWTRPTF
eukprot:gene2907-biopygen5118